MTKPPKIWIAVAVVALGVLAAGIGFGRPAYRHFKETRALGRARAFVQKGDYRSALLSLRVTLGLNSSNVVAARLMADVLDQGQSPAAVGWRKRVADLEPTLDNRIAFAASALHYEQTPFPVSARALEDLRPLAETNTAYHLVSSQLALRLNRLAEAEAHLESAVRLDPTNRQHEVNLATVQLQSADTNKAAAARGKLAALAADPVFGLSVLRSLTADCMARRDLAGAEEYSRRLQSHPQATLDDRLLHLTALSDAGSPELTPALARVQAGCATNGVTLAQALSWMNTHKLARPALEWAASLPRASRQALPVPMAEADCYITLADWPGLQEHLAAQRWEEQEFLRMALLARALREEGDTESGGRNWRQAVNSAAARPELTLALLQLARTWGWEEEARDLLWNAARRTPADEWPLKALLQDYAAREDSAGLYRVYQTLLERHADSLEFKNNVAALGLLLGRDLARSTELAREVYGAGKTNVALASTYAYALHTQGRTAEGLKLLQTFPETQLQHPEIALYYGVLLVAAGERDQALPYLAAAEKRRPLAEERALLEKAKLQNKR